jgi:hypothetical protein
MGMDNILQAMTASRDDIANNRLNTQDYQRLAETIVSAQQTHVELMPFFSQDRVHANHRGHYAQRFRDFQIFSPAHPPDLYA